uniref:Uncharacterized protein n=1 Tax=Lepeophtheirus salmonis TaxID=72036 RepID=A0A0K2U983_LEPSM
MVEISFTPIIITIICISKSNSNTESSCLRWTLDIVNYEIIRNFLLKERIEIDYINSCFL